MGWGILKKKKMCTQRQYKKKSGIILKILYLLLKKRKSKDDKNKLNLKKGSFLLQHRVFKLFIYVQFRAITIVDKIDEYFRELNIK